MRPLCVVVGLMLAGRAAHAQSPRAGGPAPGDDPSSRVAVEGALSGNIARGFVDRELISARGILQAWSGPLGFYVQPYWLYGRVGTPMGKLTTDNEVYVRTGVFRALTGPLFAYGVTVYDRSVRRQIEHRNLAGAGLGVTLWQCKGSSLLSSVGVLHEVADYGGKLDKAPLLEDGREGGGLRNTARWSIRIYGRYKLADGKLNLLHDLIVIPSFRDPSDDYRVLFYGAIDAPIAKGFSARISADATREGLIVAGTKHDDLAITFGVAYKNEWPPKPPPK
ncbi:MAG: DUF481 domain-containing protein [Deltaproteobacteria bacterium]|nr:DUF481 domain-containing protein [Deltaproteobacteria bacterium]